MRDSLGSTQLLQSDETFVFRLDGKNSVQRRHNCRDPDAAHTSVWSSRGFFRTLRRLYVLSTRGTAIRENRCSAQCVTREIAPGHSMRVMYTYCVPYPVGPVAKTKADVENHIRTYLYRVCIAYKAQ